jgi:hypothetical protein
MIMFKKISITLIPFLVSLQSFAMKEYPHRFNILEANDKFIESNKNQNQLELFNYGFSGFGFVPAESKPTKNIYSSTFTDQEKS